jgi:para-aminobenzoate synthetase component I
MLPLVQEIDFQEPAALFRCFSDMPWSIFLDSALISSTDHFSFIGVDPFLKIQNKNKKTFVNKIILTGDPFEHLRNILVQHKLEIDSNLCPFQGGAMGYFGYDLCQHLESYKNTAIDKAKFPDMCIGLYDLVLGFNLKLKKSWIFSSGHPEKEISSKKNRAMLRKNFLLDKINAFKQKKQNPLFFSGIKEKIQSNFDQVTYEAIVKKATQYILNGDIFQVNLSQYFSGLLEPYGNPFALYEKLRHINPAPYAAYLNLSPIFIVSASPEQFLKLQNKIVTTKPIKGTSPRGKTAKQDKKLADALLKSEKDRAENIMIVDLMRNDFSRVCEDNSINVSKLCALESFATVHHLVSTITGKLQTNKDAIDLLKAAFPAGSVTGAPKIRAMEIIAENEKIARGPYCGNIGYIGFNGDMELSVTIRTFTIQNQQIIFQAGGAIVANSNPTREYEETLLKAQALFEAL